MRGAAPRSNLSLTPPNLRAGTRSDRPKCRWIPDGPPPRIPIPSRLHPGSKTDPPPASGASRHFRRLRAMRELTGIHLQIQPWFAVMTESAGRPH